MEYVISRRVSFIPFNGDIFFFLIYVIDNFQIHQYNLSIFAFNIFIIYCNVHIYNLLCQFTFLPYTSHLSQGLKRTVSSLIDLANSETKYILQYIRQIKEEKNFF